MRTRTFFRNVCLILAGFILIGMSACDNDDGDTLTIDEFIGSWTATSMVHTNNANPAQSFDMVPYGGVVRFTMLAGGKVRTWVEIDTFSDEWDALATLSGNVITSVPEEAGRPVRVSTFEYDGTVLKLTNVDDEFNFTGGVEPNVSTTSVGTFQRH